MRSLKHSQRPKNKTRNVINDNHCWYSTYYSIFKPQDTSAVIWSRNVNLMVHIFSAHLFFHKCNNYRTNRDYTSNNNYRMLTFTTVLILTQTMLTHSPVIAPYFLQSNIWFVLSSEHQNITFPKMSIDYTRFSLCYVPVLAHAPGASSANILPWYDHKSSTIASCLLAECNILLLLLASEFPKEKWAIAASPKPRSVNKSTDPSMSPRTCFGVSFKTCFFSTDFFHIWSMS